MTIKQWKISNKHAWAILRLMKVINVLCLWERGPSYTDVNQIWNWKLIHIRFVENKLIPRDRRRSKTRENEHSNATSTTSRATEDTNEKRNLSLPMPSYSGVTGVTP